MIFSREMLDEITRTGEPAHFRDCVYDLVIDRMEGSGFKNVYRYPPIGGFEGSVYGHPEKGLFKVWTSRIEGPITVVEPYSEKPDEKG